jgi:hypothetical protein
MPIRKLLRESAFNLARRDVASFLADHEADILAVFHEEMQRLDDEIPEENLYIDIKMVPLGEAILKAALHAITRFLSDDIPSHGEGNPQPSADAVSESQGLTLKDTAL